MKKLFTLLLLLCTSAWAWQPTKTINVITGYAAGSNNELTFRKASDIVSRNNPGIVFVIQGRPGQDGVIAMNSFVTAEADGHNVAVPSIFSIFVGNDVFQEDIKKYNWLPSTCAYRLLNEGKELPAWHPLISGNIASVKRAGVSISSYAITESSTKNIEEHIIRWLT